MTSQLVIFKAFLKNFFAPDPRSEKKSRKSTNKKNLALECGQRHTHQAIVQKE